MSRMMRAVVFRGKHSIDVQDVPLPVIKRDTDAIVRVTSSGLCGSDRHLYNGYNPAMKKGDILGHEFVGEVVDKGSAVSKLNIGDKVIVPFPIACGECEYCNATLTSLCDVSNKDNSLEKKLYGASTCAIYGYSDLYGGIDGGQAQFVRVLFADANCFVVPGDIADEKLVPLTDVVPTAWQAVEQAIKISEFPVHTVAIFGLGPVGQMAVICAKLQGVRRIIAVDYMSGRLDLAVRNGAEVINFEAEKNVDDRILSMTQFKGVDVSIDCTGLEAFAHGVGAFVHEVAVRVGAETDKPIVLNQCAKVTRKGGVISVPGVYAGAISGFNFGACFAKGLRLVGGQTHVHRLLGKLFDMVRSGQLDPSFLFTDIVPLDKAPQMYKAFNEQKTLKVLFKPWAAEAGVGALGATTTTSRPSA